MIKKSKRENISKKVKMKPFRVDSNGMRKGVWSKEEDHKLRAYIQRYGHWNWRLLPKYAGLERCGKSCRLRWVNYLKPGVKKGNFSKEEEDIIIQLHANLGNKWSTIASKFPGRTDNDIKNYWHSHIRKRRKREVTEAEMTTKDESRVEVDQELSSQISPPDNIVESELENLFPLFTDNPINCIANDHTSSSDSVAKQDFWSQPCQINYFESSKELVYGELSMLNPYTLSPLYWPEEDSSSSSDAFAEF